MSPVQTVTYVSGLDKIYMAEREGFEPSERLRAQRFSRPPRSTTPAPLRGILKGTGFKWRGT